MEPGRTSLQWPLIHWPPFSLSVLDCIILAVGDFTIQVEMDCDERYLLPIRCDVASVAVFSEIHTTSVFEKPETLIQPRDAENVIPSRRPISCDASFVFQCHNLRWEMWENAIQQPFGKDLIIQDNAITIPSLGGKYLAPTSDVDQSLFPLACGLCDIEELIAFCWLG